MALDVATLTLCARQLNDTLQNARIDKIHQPGRDEVLLHMRRLSADGRAKPFRLLLSARSGCARVCLTQQSYENPQSPPSFCMLLRKHLSGGRLVSVSAQQGDRIVYFHFDCFNEMGDSVRNILAAELMGRYCNLVLIRAQEAQSGEGAQPDISSWKIIDALKRVHFEDSDVRQLLPGLMYTLPAQAVRISFFALSPLALSGMLSPSLSLTSALRKTVSDVGPCVIRELVFRAFGAQDPLVQEIDAEGWRRLQSAAEDIQGDYAMGGKPTIVYKADGTPTEFSFTRLTQYPEDFIHKVYPSFSELLEGYYAEKDHFERMQQKSKQLHKTVQTLCERAVRKQAARREDLLRSEQSEHLRIAGELLTANLHELQRGDACATLLNWYTGQMQDIVLDVRLTPSQNAQKYFKDYKKRQTAAAVLKKLLSAGENEIVYLQTVLYEVEQAQNEAALGEIRAELKAQGYLKHYKPRDKRAKPSDFIRYVSVDGFDILVGRNNTQNDKLTLKIARGKDMWFHVKNAPGSHVVILSEGADIPLDTQNEAAMLAVWHSGQRNGSKVAVDYTQVKNIRKTSDLPPGMVLYERYETAWITAEPAEIEKIQKQ